MVGGGVIYIMNGVVIYMKILSQDKTKIVNALLLKVDKELFSKKPKGVISAVYRADSFFLIQKLLLLLLIPMIVQYLNWKK